MSMRSNETITSSSAHRGACQLVGELFLPAAGHSQTQHLRREGSRIVHQAVVLPSDNKCKSKSEPTVNPNATGTNVSAAIVEAVYSHSNGTASLHAKDRNGFMREVLTLIHTNPSIVNRLWAEYNAWACSTGLCSIGVVVACVSRSSSRSVRPWWSRRVSTSTMFF